MPTTATAMTRLTTCQEPEMPMDWETKPITMKPSDQPKPAIIEIVALIRPRWLG